MITEEMIKQTKFFMGKDGKCYLVRDVRTVKLVSLICTRDGSESDLLLGDDICSQFEPTEASFEPFIQNQETAKELVDKPIAKKARGPYKKRVAEKTKPKHIAGLRGRRNQFSQHKGVTRGKPKKDGTITYRANVWDGKQKKNLKFGTFNNELLAAAAVQDYKGNKEEARKLRDMAAQQEDGKYVDAANMKEQAENNPNRPTHQAKKKKGVTVYVCKRCGSKWETKPTHCIHCQCDDFREVEKEGD